MKRHELWRQQYRNRRYLEHVSLDDLLKRMDDVFRNSLTLTEEGKIGVHPVSPEGEYWMILFTHLLEEFSLRGGGIPQQKFISEATVPTASWPEQPLSVKALKGRRFAPGSCFIKYGSKRRLRSMFESGALRVAPATIYKDSSLNSAIYDDERVLDVLIHPSEVKMTHIDPVTGKETEIPAIGDVKATFEAKTNYYVYCMSYVYDPRLFGDFGADACVVIKDMRGFLKKLDAAFTREVGRWLFSPEPVLYVDPFSPPSRSSINVFFAKHFRYTYQKEVRAVWVPPAPVEKLDPVYLELGSMEPYAEYIELEDG